jgi:FkbM family methyltransferase
MPSALLHRAVGRTLGRFGLRLVRTGGHERATIEGALSHLAGLGLSPRTVLDVGAAYGDWSAACAAVFPAARYVLVEPLEEYAPFLERRLSELGGAVHVAAAVGSEPGELELHVHPDLVGSSTRAEREPAVEGELRAVRAARIDDLVEEAGAEPPFLLKLDVQGAELDALAGAERTLERSDAVVLEALLFEFYVGGPQLADLVAALAARGFAVYDLVDLAYRPLDGALAQADLVLVRADGPLRADHRYATDEQRRQLNARFRADRERRLRATP